MDQQTVSGTYHKRTKGLRYDPEIKAQAVARSYEVSSKQAAKEFGILPSTLSRWRKKARSNVRRTKYTRRTTTPTTTTKTTDQLTVIKSLLRTVTELIENL